MRNQHQNENVAESFDIDLRLRIIAKSAILGKSIDKLLPISTRKSV